MEAGGTVEAKKNGGAGAAAGGDQDLSMEEILQSIRRIIAEDDTDKKPAPAAQAKPSEEIPGSDVLELTEMLKEDGSIVNVKEEAPAPAKSPEKPQAPAVSQGSPSDVLAKINEALAEPAAEAAGAPAVESQKQPEPVTQEPAAVSPPPASQAAPTAMDSLLSQAAASAVNAQFRRLQNTEQTAADTHVPSPPFRSGNTVEDLVTEMLRPMMKEWLDNNLPQIVERIVEREVRKLTQ